MNVLAGCHDARNMIHIKDIECSKCGRLIEVFIKDGISIVDSKCENCDFIIEGGTKIPQDRS